MIKEGVINLNKPPGMTSHDCIYALRRITGIKRIGHTGTLDPNATGVLPICIGTCSRIAEYTDLDYKTYRCTLRLGIETDTLDIWGKVLNVYEGVFPTESEIIYAFQEFQGIIDQYPPKYSAIRIGGRRLYEYARAGEEVEIKSRKVYIDSLTVENIDLMNREVTFIVTCSKGTYIRTICDDVGRKLGCMATMTGLERIASGKFTIQNSVTLEELRATTGDEINKYILSPDFPLVHFGDAVIKTEERSKWFVNGGHIKFSEVDIIKRPKFEENDPPLEIRLEYKQAYNMYAPSENVGEKGIFLGVAFYNDTYKKLVADKIFFRY